MSSQLDLDQGGTARIYQKVWLGPSVGWIQIPNASVLPIVAPGTYNIQPSTNYITVQIAGPVIIILPTSGTPAAGPQAIPNLFAQSPITIIDVGGFASGDPITIRALPGETIMGLASVQITVNYGAFTLMPNSSQLTWSSVSP